MLVLPCLSPVYEGVSMNFFSHALFKEFQDTSFLGVQTLYVMFSRLILVMAQHGKQRTIEIGFDHLWVHITFAADSFGVTKMPGGNFNGLAHVFLSLRLCLELP